MIECYYVLFRPAIYYNPASKTICWYTCYSYKILRSEVDLSPKVHPALSGYDKDIPRSSHEDRYNRRSRHNVQQLGTGIGSTRRLWDLDLGRMSMNSELDTFADPFLARCYAFGPLLVDTINVMHE